MVDKHGMPAFFLTLTADEVSGDVRWEEIKDLDTFMLKFNAGLNWQNAPVECATMFHERAAVVHELVHPQRLCKSLSCACTLYECYYC
jgi:hypothetical protein